MTPCIKRLATTAALVGSLALAACDENDNLRPEMRLPPLPNDLRVCLQRSGIDIPKRALTVGEIERLWKEDRITIVAMRNCGNRIIAFYNTLRKRWR